MNEYCPVSLLELYEGNIFRNMLPLCSFSRQHSHYCIFVSVCLTLAAHQYWQLPSPWVASMVCAAPVRQTHSSSLSITDQHDKCMHLKADKRCVGFALAYSLNIVQPISVQSLLLLQLFVIKKTRYFLLWKKCAQSLFIWQ